MDQAQDRDKGKRIRSLRGTNHAEVWPAVVFLSAGLILTAGVTLHVKAKADNTARQEFAFICNEVRLKMDERLSASDCLLQSLKAFFNASDTVTWEKWRRFTTRLGIEQHCSGIQGIGFAALLQYEPPGQHVRDTIGEGSPASRAWPEGDGTASASIVYFKSFASGSRDASGDDMLAQPACRLAMELARDRDSPALSGKVSLANAANENVQTGIVMYVPIYHSGIACATVEQRRANLLGWAFGSYRMDDFMSGILGKWSSQKGRRVLHLKVYDGETASPDAVLYDSQAEGGEGTPHGIRFALQTSIEHAGRHWTLCFSQARGSIYADEYRRVWFVLLFGTIGSLLGLGFVLFLRKIQFTARQIAGNLTNELKESRLRLELALRGSDMGMWDWDIPSGRIDFSDHWAEMLGYSLDEIEPNITAWECLTHPDDWRSVRAALDLHLRGETCSYESEHRMRHKDGRWVWIQDRGKVVERGLDGAPIRATGTQLDVTTRKSADIKLRQSEEQLRLIVDGVKDYAIVMLDKEGHVVSWNSGAEHILGYRAEEIVGRHFSRFYIDDDIDLGKPEQQLAIAMKEGKFEEEDWRLRRDGSRFMAHVTIAPLHDEGKRLHGFVKVTRDITTGRQAEAEYGELQAQFRQAQKMEAVGRLSGGVAHDFNNMLQVIISYAELALEGLEPSDPLHAAIQQIMEAGRRSAALARQLLAFTRKQAIVPKVLDLNVTIANMFRMLQRLIGEDIDLAMAAGQDLWDVRMDPSQVDQILANLVVNSRDAISGVGKMTIKTGNEELTERSNEAVNGFLPSQYVLLSVGDNGCGMDEETQKRLFEPFFTTKPQGTGLGLSTVYGIVKQNGGFIDVWSQLGKGTTITIHLPRYRSGAAAIAEVPKPAVAENGTETVLLVDDEEAILRLGALLLTKRGYKALVASSPGRAIQLSEQYAGDIHLLLTDAVMPDMSGRELMKELLTQRPGLKCLYMSGYIADAIGENGVLEKGIHFLQKPFSMEQLAVRMREVLDGHS